MSCPWFYGKSGSDYEAVTGNNKLFWVISLKNLDSSGGTLARTYSQSRRAEGTVQRLHLNRSWLLTGLFSSNRAVQIQPCVSLKKVWGSKIWNSAIGMEQKLIRGQWVIFETLIFITHKFLSIWMKQPKRIYYLIMATGNVYFSAGQH